MHAPLSVSTLDDALLWLLRYTRPEEYIFDPDADLPQAAQFACDMFWISPADMCRKLRAFFADIPQARRSSVPPPLRRAGSVRGPIRR